MRDKIYVLDTNVILSDPQSIYAFGDNRVVIPSVVLEELDNKKKVQEEIGRNARYFSRMIDEFRAEGKLIKGVKMNNGGTLQVVIHDSESKVFDTFLDDKNDNAIIAVAKTLTEHNEDADVILVSKDILVRVKADIVSVKAEDYQHDKVVTNETDLYQGYTEVYVDDHLINSFYNEKQIAANTDQFKSYPENHYFILKSSMSDKKTAIGRKNGDVIHPLYNYKNGDSVFGLTHRNVQQMMALDLLLDPDIPIVTISAKAGTGKTLLSIAAALSETLDEQRYNRVLVARPIVPMGKDLGYLPGELDEKLQPWMQPIYDNLEYLLDCKNDKELSKKLEGYEDIIKVEALLHIRGRSIPKQFFCVDEGQNLSQHEAKTIATRLGEGSKLVITGDPEQIDSPYLDRYSNGLTYIIEKLKNEKIAGHITLKKGERSTVAEICADIL